MNNMGYNLPILPPGAIRDLLRQSRAVKFNFRAQNEPEQIEKAFLHLPKAQREDHIEKISALCQGNSWGWCEVICQGTWSGISAEISIRRQSYRNKQAFLRNNTQIKTVKEQVIDELASVLAQVLKDTGELIRPESSQSAFASFREQKHFRQFHFAAETDSYEIAGYHPGDYRKPIFQIVDSATGETRPPEQPLPAFSEPVESVRIETNLTEIKATLAVILQAVLQPSGEQTELG